MIKNKYSLQGKISGGQIIKGKLNNAIVKVYPELEDLKVTPSGEEQHFKSNKYGYSDVIVEAVESEQLNITPSKEAQNYEGIYSKVTVAGDENLAPENIKKDVNIFGIQGQFIGENNAKINTQATSSKYKIIDLLEEVPLINISKVTDIRNMFSNCSSLKTIPQFDTSKITNMAYMFSGCKSLETIPQLDTSNVINMAYMFSECTSLVEIPQLDTSNVTNMEYMFKGCGNLTQILRLDTSKTTDIREMFANCFQLKSIPLLDTSNVGPAVNILNNSNALINVGGFKNLGMAYPTTMSENHYNFGLSITSPKLTHESLMNIINNLFDIKSKGCKNQRLNIGATNKAKLTSEEIAIAENKGWNVT